MTRAELVAMARNRLDDNVVPYEWADAELQDYADEAYIQAVIRMGGILDSDTASLCTIAVTASDGTYALNSKILSLVRAKLTSQDRPLIQSSLEYLDAWIPGWESTTGTPIYFTEDKNRHVLRIYPIPDTDDTLNLTIRRRPITLLTADETEPSDIEDHLHPGLVHWMCYLALLNINSDVSDSSGALLHKELFSNYFGPERSGNDQENERNFRPKQVSIPVT